MIENEMNEKRMALIFKNDKAVGWMSTYKEADMFCNKNHNYSWDFYSHHKNYVSLNELIHMNIYSKT